MSEELTQAAEPVSNESRFASYLAQEDGSPEPQPDIQEDVPPVEAQDDSDEPVADIEAEQVAPEPEYFEIVHNGETKRLPKDEALALARQGFDYTQKTQSLAEQRKAFEAEVSRQQQAFALQNQQIETIAEIKALDADLAKFANVNWHQLAELDPVDYLKLNQTYRDLKEARESKVQGFQKAFQESQAIQAQTQREILAKQADELSRLVPDFSGDKAEASRAKLREYLGKSGYKDAEISSVSDARTVALAWKAMKYDALQSAKADANKKVQNLPKVVQPGVQNSKAQQNAEKTKTLRAQLRKTGKIPSGLLARFI